MLRGGGGEGQSDLGVGKGRRLNQLQNFESGTKFGVCDPDSFLDFW